MKRIQYRLGLALLFAELVVGILFLTVLLTGSLGFLYRGVAALPAVHTLLLLVAYLSVGVLFIVMAILAGVAALQPAKFLRKLIYVLPAFALGLALVGVVFNLANIGAGVFAGGWLAAGALLSGLASLVVAFRVRLGEKALKTVLAGIGVTNLLGLVGWAGMLVVLALVLTNQPSSFSGRNFPGTPGGEGGLPVPGTAARGGGGENAQGAPPEGGGFRGAGGFGEGRGFGEGGSLPLLGAIGNPQNFRTTLIAGAALMALAAAALVVTTLRARGALLSTPTETGSLAAGSTSLGQAGPAALALGVVVVIFLGAIQLVPVSTSDPPVQTSLQWDSPVTQELATRACMDCHSNQTRWPWYAKLAPGSWLTALHVDQGRQRLNLSELNNLPASGRSRLAEEIAQQIQRGTMPPNDYLLLHPDARLSEAEQQQLIQGFQTTLAK